MSVDILVGGQWGDEGKAKVVDVLASRYDYVVRYQGGANAGHTVHVGSNRYVFHQIPSGILNPNTCCVLGNGMVIDIVKLCEELNQLKAAVPNLSARLKLSDRAVLVLPYHQALDAAAEKHKADFLGTTKRGIGPAYSDKVARTALRLCELADPNAFKQKLQTILSAKQLLLTRYYQQDFPYTVEQLTTELNAAYEQLKPCICDTTYLLNDAIIAGKSLLLEGAQGAGLDIDFGTYPYVTSSSTISGGASCGSGIAPRHFKHVIGIFKAYVTRVGEGALPTALSGSELEQLRKLGGEFGATTGRPRLCGWFDAMQARYAVMINGFTAIALTKLDILSGYERLKVATHYQLDGKRITQFPASHAELARVQPVYQELAGWEAMDFSAIKHYKQLPATARVYIEFLEEVLECPITMISTGSSREAFIKRSASQTS